MLSEVMVPPKYSFRTEMAFSALSFFGVEKNDAVIVGDRLYTDIKCGANAGIDTVLVLSGESTVEDIEKFGVRPTAVARSVRDMISPCRS